MLNINFDEHLHILKLNSTMVRSCINSVTEVFGSVPKVSKNKYNLI
jgi:hypothetical protein